MRNHAKQKPRTLKLSSDDFVRLILSHANTFQGDFAVLQRQSLMDFAATFAMRFGTRTKVYDELVEQNLKLASTGGMRYALMLTPYAGKKAREHVLRVMFSIFGTRNVNQIVSYAEEFLGRDLMLHECTALSHKFASCPNESDKVERRKLLKYIEEKFPKQLNKFIKYFEREDKFWEGPGSIL